MGYYITSKWIRDNSRYYLYHNLLVLLEVHNGQILYYHLYHRLFDHHLDHIHGLYRYPYENHQIIMNDYQLLNFNIIILDLFNRISK